MAKDDTKFQNALTEDLRRFGLVLIGAGLLTQIDTFSRIMTMGIGALLLLGAYGLLRKMGEDE